MVAKVAIGAGHGGFGVTPGKRTPDGEYEWDFNNKVVLAAIKYLKQYQGVEIMRLDDPSGKTDVPLSTRTNKANTWGADIYVSCHHNANTGVWGDWTGTETFYYVGSAKGKKLAQLIHAKVLKAYGLRDRGIKRGNHLYVIKNTKMPAVLVEGGFMDSRVDINKLRDDGVLDAAGKAIAEGVAKYFGLKKTGGQSKPPKTSKPATKPSKASSTKWTGQILRKGDSGSLVKSLQELLISKGFPLPKYGADGQFGDETENAVRAAQRATGIPVDGIPGPQTYKALKNYDGFRFHHWNGSIIRNGEKGKHVTELQERLLSLGYKLPRYGADGVMGKETANAVRQFQSDAGIGVDGVPGPQTKRALERRG